MVLKLRQIKSTIPNGGKFFRIIPGFKAKKSVFFTFPLQFNDAILILSTVLTVLHSKTCFVPKFKCSY